MGNNGAWRPVALRLPLRRAWEPTAERLVLAAELRAQTGRAIGGAAAARVEPAAPGVVERHQLRARLAGRVTAAHLLGLSPRAEVERREGRPEADDSGRWA
jgi:hypothetical protein